MVLHKPDGISNKKYVVGTEVQTTYVMLNYVFERVTIPFWAKYHWVIGASRDAATVP